MLRPAFPARLLAIDSENDRINMLVRLAPGVDYPPHTHASGVMGRRIRRRG
jgi:hypothetical protein